MANEQDKDMGSMGRLKTKTPVQQIDPIVLDEQSGHLLRRAHQRASAIFAANFGDRNLTPTQFFALARLYEMGQLSQNRLGRLAGMDPATIQGVIRRLADRGYIDRLPDPRDRRRMVLRLSSDGRHMAEQLMLGATRVHESILEPLSREEQEQFLTLLKRLV